MIVCRPITRTEADQFLEILCTVFELSVQRASPVFFNEPSFDVNRKWACFENGTMKSILTSTPLIFGSSDQKRAMGIAGVATLPEAQGKGFAGMLVKSILEYGRNNNEPRALLFAKNPSLYTQLGFEVLDEIVEGPIECDGEDELQDDLDFDSVHKIYDEFSAQDDSWLHRDDLRWAVWKWSVRCCQPTPSGYICHEGMTIREAIFPNPGGWPISRGTNWMGLKSVTEAIQVPTTPKPTGSSLMGIGFDFAPQMFLTDQF